MGLRRFSSVAVLVVALLAGSGAVVPTAAAQVPDTEIPILTSVSRVGPATAQGPTTMRVAYAATDASPAVRASALITDPHGNWRFVSEVGNSGVLELPLTISDPPGLYYLTYLALTDSATPPNSGSYGSNGGVGKGSGSTGPTTHTVNLSAADFTLTQAGPAPWVTVPLRPLTEGQQTTVHDVSALGTSVGSSGTAPQITPVKWDIAGAPANLPVPAGCNGAAVAISDDATIVGQLTCNTFPQDRFRVWYENGTTRDQARFAQDVDDLGIVVGSENAGDGTAHAIAVLTDNSIKLLEDSTAEDSVARAMTNYGYVVGDVLGLPGAGNADQIAVGWWGDSVFPLWDITVPSSAVDVNHLGYALIQVKAPGATRGALVGPKGAVVLLDDHGDTDQVLDLNHHGVVLGIRTVGAEQVGVFYLGPNAVLRLDSIVTAGDKATWGYRNPVAVDDVGRVVGNTDGVAWILQPPPF